MSKQKEIKTRLEIWERKKSKDHNNVIHDDYYVDYRIDHQFIRDTIKMKTGFDMDLPENKNKYEEHTYIGEKYYMIWIYSPEIRAKVSW